MFIHGHDQWTKRTRQYTQSNSDSALCEAKTICGTTSPLVTVLALFYESVNRLITESKKKNNNTTPVSKSQSCILSTDRIEIHQSQPASMTKRRSEGHTGGCDWWISIQSVDNTQDWRKFGKRFRGCFVFQSRVSTVIKPQTRQKLT